MNTSFIINSDTLSKAFELMWKGMLGIFTVLILIAICVYLFSLLDKKKK